MANSPKADTELMFRDSIAAGRINLTAMTADAAVDSSSSISSRSASPMAYGSMTKMMMTAVSYRFRTGLED